ncbi:hypothetical protein K4G61_g1118 [Candida parapsilosis]|nr:hypothetical protein K4G61_g1118 [Candida parapsilosis]
MTKLFTKLFKLANCKSNTKSTSKPQLIPYVRIPQQYQPQLGKGDLKEAGLLVNFDHLEVFRTLCCYEVTFMLNIYHLLHNLKDGDAIRDVGATESDFSSNFHEKYKQILSQLSYFSNNSFTQDQVEGLRFLFNDVRYTWNVITVANSLKVSLGDSLKHNINGYFKKMWAFEVSENDEEFMIDVFSVSLDIWERRVLALVASKGDDLQSSVSL